LCKGKFGLYIKYDKNNYSINKNINEINLEMAKNIIENKNKYSK
jgi:topoisomerase IA-like protein